MCSKIFRNLCKSTYPTVRSNTRVTFTLFATCAAILGGVRIR